MTQHIPVLETEVLNFLEAKLGGDFLDCTFGGGGHTTAILKADERNCVCAIDRDSRAIGRGKELEKSFADRLQLQHGSFEDLSGLFAGRKFKGILADLGISSDQLAEGRGFSFLDQDSLDMRMDETTATTALDIVNSYSEQDLRLVFQKGGAAKEARIAASEICARRPISTAKDLASIIDQALPVHLRKSGKNAATLIFQALRIETNKELDQLSALLDVIPSLAKPGARAAIISFHSLEDEIVTKRFRNWSRGDTRPAHLRVGPPEFVALGKLLTPKAVTPSEQELQTNRRARSARLRVFEFFS